MRSKKLFKKKHIRHYRAKKSLLKNKLRSKNYNSLKKKRSKILYRNLRKSNKSKKRQLRRHIKRKKVNMAGGGIPLGGTIKGMLGLTHNEETSRENMVDNLCALNSVRPTQDSQLAGILNQVCNLNTNVKKDRKENGGLVKGALRLIGNVATLPLRTASGVVKNVTGFNPGEAVYNSIKNSISSEEDTKQKVILLPESKMQGGVQNQLHTQAHSQVQSPAQIQSTGQMLGGVQHLSNNNSQPQIQPQIQTGNQMIGGTQGIERIRDIESKLSNGEALSQDDISILSSL